MTTIRQVFNSKRHLPFRDRNTVIEVVEMVEDEEEEVVTAEVISFELMSSKENDES